jgi:hypothetical protein
MELPRRDLQYSTAALNRIVRDRLHNTSSNDVPIPIIGLEANHLDFQAFTQWDE